MVAWSRALLRGGLFLGATSLVLACGSEVTVFSDGPNPAAESGDGSTANVGVGPSSGSGVPTPSTGNSTSAGNGGSASVGPSSGSGGSEPTSGAGAGPPMTTGSGNPSSMLECGGSNCPLGGDNSCCWDNYEQHGQPQAQCAVGDIDGDSCMTPHNNAGIEPPPFPCAPASAMFTILGQLG